MIKLRNSKYSRLVIFVLSLSLVLQGCAGMFNGSTQDVAINTVPANATITVDTQPGATYTAPATIELERNKIHRIIAHYDGHTTTSASLTPRNDGMAITIDCVLWLCIPLLFDWPLGAIKELKPSNLTIVLPEAKEVSDVRGKKEKKSQP